MKIDEIIKQIDDEIDQIEINGMVPEFIICSIDLHTELIGALSGNLFRSDIKGDLRHFQIQKGPYKLTILPSEVHDGINVFAHTKPLSDEEAPVNDIKTEYFNTTPDNLKRASEFIHDWGYMEEDLPMLLEMYRTEHPTNKGVKEAKRELIMIDAMISLVQDNDLACTVSINGISIGLCENIEVLPALKSHRLQIERFLADMPNAWE